MLFRNKAKALLGQSIEIQMTNSRVLRGKLSTVGTDFLVMHVRIGRRIRRVNVRLAEILFLFALFGI
jgi:hypothetical protein